MLRWAKTLCRFGHRKGLIPDNIARELEMPKVPQVTIETFSDEQLAALLDAPDKRRWTGIRDRALLPTLLDTLCRVSEGVGLITDEIEAAPLQGILPTTFPALCESARITIT